MDIFELSTYRRTYLLAIGRVKKDRVLKVIQLADAALRRIDIDNPKIAVAGLNPHAGENGLFGTEEIDEIIPAIEAAKKFGIHVEGPFPPDTIFPKMKGGQYDVVVCMYHDQGHIPTSFWDSITIMKKINGRDFQV